MSKFTSFLKPLIEAYIFYQKASDRWNESSYEVHLLIFDRYCKRQYPVETELSQEMVDSWCKKRESETNNSCRTRIYPIISFIRYLRKREKTTIMEPVIPQKEPRTYIPHSFTETELKNFFAACDSIPSSPKTESQLSRKITIPVYFRLLYSSGIRTNEARMLKCEDADLINGILNIQYSKGHAQHYIVLHDSMLELMKQYDTAISKQYPNRTYFFPARKDSFHTSKWVQRNFRTMWDICNGSHTTAYALRHNYAVENINQWIGMGFAFDDKLLYLSKSMGHSVLESTRYYYSLVPGLVDILEARSDDDMIIPEVQYDENL